MSPRLAAPTLALVLLALGCTTEDAAPRTGLIVVVQSDLTAGPELERVMLEARRHDGRHTLASVELGEGEGQHRLPFSFAVYARAADRDERVELHVSGYGAGDLDPAVRRSARVGFREGELVRLVLPLPRACRPRFRACEADGKTCAGSGDCIGLEINVQDLPAIDPGEELFGLIELPSRGPDEGEGAAGGAPTGHPGDAKEPREDDEPGEISGPSPDASMAPAAPSPHVPPMDAGTDTGASSNAQPDAMPNEMPDTSVPPDATPDATPDEIPDATTDVTPDGEPDDMPDTAVEAGMSDPPACDYGETRCRGAILQSCFDGEWGDLACYAGCTEPGASSSHEVSGVAALAAACDPCIAGDLRCGRNQVLSCGLEGEVVSSPCHFGCILSPLAVCQETTPNGVALLLTVVD